MNDVLKLITTGESECPKCGGEAALYPSFSDSGLLTVTGLCFKNPEKHKFEIEYIPVAMDAKPDLVTPVFWRVGQDGFTRTAVVMTGDDTQGSIDVVDTDGKLLVRMDITYNIPGKKNAMIIWTGAEVDSPVRETNLFSIQNMKNAFQLDFK